MEIIKKNWKTKLLSVLLAIFFWSFVIVSENPVVTTWVTNVPIVYENIDKLENSGLILTDDIENSVEVKVSGQRSNVINITAQHIRVSADFTFLSEGDHVIPLNYSVPGGVTIEEAPKEIAVNIEKVLNKEFSVSIINDGEMPENYLLEGSTVAPEKVTIIGARSKLDSIDKVVANLNLDGLKKDTTLNSDIKAINKEGEEIEDIVYGQQFVNINTIVYKQKEVDVNIKFTGESPENTRIEKSSLNRSKVFIKGPEKVIDSVNSIDTQDIDKSVIKNSRQIPVNLSLPSDVSLVNPDLSHIVDVEVSEKTTKEIKIPSNKVEVTVNSNNTFLINTEEIVLVLLDYPSDLDKINENDVKISVDASADSAGTKLYTPKVYIKGEELEQGKIDRVSSISITIK